MKAEQDRLSYTLGFATGSAMAKDGVDVSSSGFKHGLEDALKHKKPALTPRQMQGVMRQFTRHHEAKIKTQPTSYHLGYLLAPRINAAGRLSDAKFAVKLLTATSNNDSIKIAQELNELNIKRRSLENLVLNEALVQIEINSREKDSLIWVASDKWHPGVVGIVAARIKEKLNKPRKKVKFTWKGAADFLIGMSNTPLRNYQLKK